MSDPIVQVRGLVRVFGTVRAVEHVSFDIQRGSVVGFIGANGAGKTTTMRMMATLDVPDGGSIHIDGFDVMDQPDEVRRRIGWMPDAYGAYDNMTVHEYLDFYARAFGFRGAARRNRVAEVMDFTDLVPIADRPMNKLSKGMSQRLCLGRTLLHDPSLMILDEPAAGLDPKARIEFKHLVRLLAGQGKTLFISSHILTELEEMCDSMLFIDAGRIVHHGTAESMKKSDGSGILTVEVSGSTDALINWIALQPGVEFFEATKNGVRMKVAETSPGQMAHLLKRMVMDGIEVTDFHIHKAKLEDAFVNMLNEIGGSS